MKDGTFADPYLHPVNGRQTPRTFLTTWKFTNEYVSAPVVSAQGVSINCVLCKNDLLSQHICCVEQSQAFEFDWEDAGLTSLCKTPEIADAVRGVVWKYYPDFLRIFENFSANKHAIKSDEIFCLRSAGYVESSLFVLAWPLNASLF